MQSGRQHLDEFTKVDTLVSSKKEDQLAPIEGAFHSDQLHLQVEGFYTLSGDSVSFRFIGPVVFSLMKILLRSWAHHFFQRLSDLLFANHPRTYHHFAEFCAAHGLHDHMIANLRLMITGIKIVYFARLFKADPNHFYH